MTWHYQVMRHYNEQYDEEWFGIHEYFPEGNGSWTADPTEILGESVEDLRWQLKAILEDLEKYGVIDYE